MEELYKMEQEQKENFKKINMVFKKVRGDFRTLWREYKKTANFTEPLLLLMRTTGQLEPMEKAKPGWFEFQHSSGEIRKIYIHPQHAMDCPFGKDSFKCWIAHEEYPDTSLGDPVITTDLFTLAIDKVNHEVLEAKTKLEKVKSSGKMWWVWLILAIGAVISAILLFKQPSTAVNTIEAVKVITVNATGGIIP